ncbi:hypothetical protein ACSNOH_00145 [Streptomyces sp. URMC 127]
MAEQLAFIRERIVPSNEEIPLVDALRVTVLECMKDMQLLG